MHICNIYYYILSMTKYSTNHYYAYNIHIYGLSVLGPYMYSKHHFVLYNLHMYYMDMYMTT